MYKYEDYTPRKEYSEDELIYTELIYVDEVPKSLFGLSPKSNTQKKTLAPNRRIISQMILLSIILLSTTMFSACGTSKIPGTVLSLDELPGKNVGVILNSLADVVATDLEIPEGDAEPCYVVRYQSLDEALKDLDKGSLDCMILEDFQANQCVKDNEDYILLDESFAYQDYTICVNADRTELKEELDEVISILKSNGSLARIQAQFSDPDSVTVVSHKNESSAKSPDTLIVATSAGYAPYCYSDSEGSLQGIDIETVYAIGEQLDKKVYLVNMDYESLFSSLEDGTVDIAIAGIEETDNLDEDFQVIHTVPYATAVQMVLARAQ